MHLWLLTDFFFQCKPSSIYWFPSPYSQRWRWSWLITHLSACTLLHPHTPHLPFSFLIFLRLFIPILTKSRVFILLWLQKRLLTPCPSRGGHLTLSEGSGKDIWKELQIEVTSRDFPGGQVVETPCFHSSWCGFDPWSENWDPTKFLKIKFKKKERLQRLSLK